MPTVIDLDTLTASQGFKIEDDGLDNLGWSVSDAGDVNGDGFADIIIGAVPSRLAYGQVDAAAAYVIFGHAGGFGPIDVTSLSMTDGFKVQTESFYDRAGYSVSGAGDVNGDGFADIIVGAQFNDGGGTNAGAAYVLFGHAGGFGTIDLGTPLTASEGFKIQGETNDAVGGIVSAAGDVNDDGFGDIIVNGDVAYVIFGKASGFGTIDLGTPLTASQGFTISPAPVDFEFSSVSAAGDVNGDGIDDIIVGSELNDGGGSNAGAAYVIFGKASGLGTIDLGTALTASEGFKIQGDANGDFAGYSVSAGGDINSDGFADIIVGAQFNDAGGSNAGAAYVIFGKASGFGTIDLGVALAPDQGFTILGDHNQAWAAESVSNAGDVNGDGFADIIIGAPGQNSAYVVFGGASGFGTIDLGNLNASLGFTIQSDASTSTAGWSVSGAGDINGDGFDDLLVGDPGYDTLDDAAYVIFGQAAVGAPAIDLNGPDAGIDNGGSYTENAGTVILASGLTVGDVDDTNLESAAVQITGGFVATLDRLTVNGLTSGTLSGIGFSYNASTGILSLTGSAPLAAYQNVLRQVGFDSAGNDPGPTRTIMWTADDGGAGSTPAFTSLDVTEINDSPAGADKVIARLEDAGGYVFTVADFGFSDVDGDNFSGFLLNGVPTPGTLLFDPDGAGAQAPAPVVSGQFITASQIANGQLSYVPAANGNGAPYASFTFQVFDDGGTANGGSNFDQSPNTIAFNVTPVNDAPAVDLNGVSAGTSTTLNYAESSPVTAIAAGATVTDVDTANYNGGRLRIQMTDGLNAEDALSVINQGNGAGQIGYAGGVVSYEGVPIADAVSPPGSLYPVLDIAFRSGTISPAAVQALVRAIGYANLSHNPTTVPDRTATFTLIDGDGTANGGVDTGIATATVHLSSTDTPPIAHNDAVTTNEATILNGNVLADNGSGADGDPDGGPAFSVTAVNGNAGAVGNQIALASGALLTLNADGTFSYNPNHAFDATPAPGSGASNTPAIDSFTYTLTGGSTATVTVSINGIDTTDVLLGTSGADNLNGGAGADAMSGGAGNDWYFADNPGDVVNELAGQGDDRVFASVSYTLAAGAEVETLTTIDFTKTTAIDLTGSDTANFIYGNAGANTLRGAGGNDILVSLAGNDVLDGGTGADTMLGRTGNDWYFVDQAGDVVIENAGEGDDRVFAAASYELAGDAEVETLTTADYTQATAIDLTGNNSANFIYGNDGANTLRGAGGNDVLASRAGNDVLDGGTGADTMAGQTGNDFYYVDNAGDLVTENAGEGDDRLVASVSYTLAAGAEVETLAVADPAAATALNLTGNELAQTFIGNYGANIIDGGGGADTMIGGGGHDIYVVDNAGDSVVELMYQGDDEVRTTLASYTLVGTNIEYLTGLGNADQILTGNDDANIIDGGAGADTMSGGRTNDTYIVDNVGDSVIELAGQGNLDEVRTSLANYVLGDNLEKLTGISPLGQSLTGNAAVNVIAGDTGNDRLDGGVGGDWMLGGFGDDLYFIDNAGDRVTELVGGGADRVFASVSYALTQTAEVEMLTTSADDGTTAIDLTGSDTANFIYGNDGANILLGLGGNDSLASRAGDDMLDGGVGNDVLDGGTGADKMVGQTGNDSYYVDNAGDYVVERAGEGDDRVFASASYALPIYAETETLTTTANNGTTAIDLTGGNSANFIYGNDGANTLWGGGGNDVLASRAGNDVLDGGTGIDTMIGALGNDHYYVDQAGDLVTELAGEGNDRVFASVSYALAAGAEVETLSTTANDGTAAINLTGSNTANFIAGNDGANLLRGGGGNDFLAARAGNDWLDGGTGNDNLQGGDGIDAFAFTASLGAGNADTILDFVHGTDKIMLDDAVFIGRPLGVLNPNAFFVGAAAHDADDRIIYNQATGKLWFDADGNGAGAAVQFATLDTHPTITASDFTVI